METTWSSVFCSKFNWKSHSCTTKQWKKLAAWKHLQAYIMSILYIKSKKMISPIPKIYAIFNLKEKAQHPKALFFSKTCDDLWYRKSSPHLTPPPVLHSPDTKEVVTFSCARKNTWQMNPPQNFANDLNEDSQTPNKILTLHHICVFKQTFQPSQVGKTSESWLNLGFPPPASKCPKYYLAVPTINGEVLQKPSRILALSFLCKETSQSDVQSDFTRCPSLWRYESHVWCWKYLEIGLDMILNHPKGGGFTNLMISCHWISNLERNKMCVCGGLVGREGLQYP